MIRLLVLVALAWPGLARADESSLAQARKAVDEIHYDEARALLVQTLKQGGNAPDELVEIYRLSGITAAVLGPTDLAEQYYRRMLALAPDATLPADASPRLREPFVAAQAYMAAQPRFDVRATRTNDGIDVTIVDPLRMVVAIATRDAGELRDKTPVGTPSTRIPDRGSHVVLLDEHGNVLRVVELPAHELAGQPALTSAPRTPMLERWSTWAIAAGVSGTATIILFVDAQLAKGRFDEIVANDSAHFFDEAESERRRWRNGTIVGWVGVAVTAGLTATAIVMARRRQHATTVVPVVGADHASVLLQAKF